MARVVPNPATSSLTIVKQYQDDMQTFNPGGFLSSDSLEAYINADVLIHVLNSINPPFKNSAIIKKIEQIKALPYKGLTLDFNKETRELMHSVWIDTGRGPWILSAHGGTKK
jgi:hypothetical protein